MVSQKKVSESATVFLCPPLKHSKLALKRKHGGKQSEPFRPF